MKAALDVVFLGLKSFDFKSNFQKTSVDHEDDDEADDEDDDDDDDDDGDRDKCEAEARGREKIGGRKAIMK